MGTGGGVRMRTLKYCRLELGCPCSDNPRSSSLSSKDDHPRLKRKEKRKKGSRVQEDKTYNERELRLKSQFDLVSLLRSSVKPFFLVFIPEF